MVTISNAGYGVTTAGVSALQVNYVGGAANIEASSIRSDITPGATSGGIWNAIRLVGGTAASGVNENALKIDNLTAGDGTEIGLNIGTGWDFVFYSQTAGANYFAGNVGIGTTAPIGRLDVYDIGAMVVPFNVTTGGGVGLRVLYTGSVIRPSRQRRHRDVIAYFWTPRCKSKTCSLG